MQAQNRLTCAVTYAMRPTRTGTTLQNTWLLGQLLGAGGMGEVYQATDMHLGREVAVKIMLPKVAADEELAARFLKEAKMLARLDHPHLIPVYAAQTDNGTPFMVMKLLEGKPLEQFIYPEKPVPAPQAIHVLSQILEGLNYLHHEGLVHRDLKPGNFIISPQGHVTILDLGVARDTHNKEMTKAGTIFGTPAYMSPEQFDKPQAVDRRSDLYSLGIVCYHMLSGTLPFDADSYVSLFMKHASERHRPLPHWIPPLLVRAVEKAIAKEPSQRFQSAEEMREALRPLFNVAQPLLHVIPAPIMLEPSSALTGATAIRVTPTNRAAIDKTVSSKTHIVDVREGQPKAHPLRRNWKRVGLLLGLLAVPLAALVIWTVALVPAPPRPLALTVDNGLPVNQIPDAPPTAIKTEQTALPPGNVTENDAALDASVADLPAPVAINPTDTPTTPTTPPVVATKGRLRLVATIKGESAFATLLIDGKRVPDAPTEVSLSAGTHSIAATGANGKTVRLSVKIQRGSTTVRSIALDEP
jgi:serine/threonine protein kinase